jgi:hypothetical protein
MNAHITGNDLRQIESGAKINLGGKEYDVIMDFNAICDLEKEYGNFDNAAEVLDGIGKDMSKPDAMKNIRFLLYVMLKHTDDDITERQVGKLFNINNMQAIMDALGNAMHSSAPQSDGNEKNVTSPQEN